MTEQRPAYQSYDACRWFHWINFLSVFCLILVGLIMIFKSEIGITALEAKISFKELHVIIGYVFAVNLIVRLIVAFVGPASSGFRAFIPQRGFMNSLSSYIQSLKAGKPQQFVCHNPLGKLAVCSLFLLLIILGITGLIRAGTDIYYPPFGSLASSYVAEEGTDPTTLMP